MRVRGKKGFTLIELLVVIMIIGIILGISIPAVVNLQKSQNAKKFDYFTAIVKEATDLYVQQYGKSFNETENCFDIPYDVLVQERLIQETDITCLSTEGQQGIIQITRIPGTNNFKYEYFLNCTDQTSGEVLHQSGIPSRGCKGVNGNFIVNIDSIQKEVDGVTSDYTLDTWTRGKIIVTLSSVNPYFYDINHYEYSLDGSNYIRMSGNRVSFESSYNGKIYFRAVDQNDNISTDTIVSIKIDNDKPTASVVFSGAENRNGWYVSDVTANCENETDGSGSGVASCTVDPQKSSGTASVAEFTLTIKDNVGNVNTIKKSANIDKIAPTYTITPIGTAYGSGYQTGVVMQVTCVDNESGIASGSQSPTFTTHGNNYVSGTCVDNAGNKTDYRSNDFFVYIYGADASCGTYSYQCGTHNCGYTPCGYQNICVEARPLNDGYGRWECIRYEYKATTVCGVDCPSYCTGTNSCWH